jgi:hypothetical protein
MKHTGLVALAGPGRPGGREGRAQCGGCGGCAPPDGLPLLVPGLGEAPA